MKVKILRKTRSLSELGRISPNNRFFLIIDQDIIGYKDENNIKRIGIKSPVFSIPEFTFDKKKKSSKNKNKKYKDIFDHEFSSIAVNEFMTMMYNR